MIITIRKTDNKLMAWNCGNTDGNPELEEIEISQDELPADFNSLYYNRESKLLIQKENIDFIKDSALSAVSARSKSERSAILDDQTIINILSGATTDYPAYLTSANVASMIEQFKTIAKTAKANIKSATTKAEIDAVLNNLRFPTEAEILAAINK